MHPFLYYCVPPLSFSSRPSNYTTLLEHVTKYRAGSTDSQATYFSHQGALLRPVRREPRHLFLAAVKRSDENATRIVAPNSVGASRTLPPLCRMSKFSELRSRVGTMDVGREISTAPRKDIARRFHGWVSRCSEFEHACKYRSSGCGRRRS